MAKHVFNPAIRRKKNPSVSNIILTYMTDTMWLSANDILRMVDQYTMDVDENAELLHPSQIRIYLRSLYFRGILYRMVREDYDNFRMSYHYRVKEEFDHVVKDLRKQGIGCGSTTAKGHVV